MGEFRVYAKISGLVDGETPEEAQKHVQRILTHLLEPKGFSVMGVAAVAGDKIPGKLVTVESNNIADSAMQVLQWLQAEVFSEEVRLSAPRTVVRKGFSLRQYPLVVSLPKKVRKNKKDGEETTLEAAIEAEGLISEAPSIMSHDFDPNDPADEKLAKYWQDKGIKYKRTGAHMPVPKGEFGYGWHVTAAFPPEAIVALEAGQSRIVAEIEGVVKQQLKGTVLNVKSARDGEEPDTTEDASRPEFRYSAKVTTDPETDEMILTLSGLFSSPLSPDELHSALHEKIGIRSILPKEVAETDPDEEPAEKATPVTEKNDFSGLLGRLFK
jgi:hypothetical protein